MQTYNHYKIDLLKLDIEGAEIVVLRDMIKNKIFPKYLCVEFDLLLKKKDNNNLTQDIINTLKNYYDIVTNENYNITFKLKNNFWYFYWYYNLITNSICLSKIILNSINFIKV